MVFPIACSIALIRREVPIMIGVGVLLSALLVFGHDHVLSRVAGIGLLVCFAAYLALTYRLARRERAEDLIAAHVDVSEDVARKSGPVVRDLAFLVGGVALLVWGADVMVKGAVDLARHFGVSELVIGLTIVGAGTGHLPNSPPPSPPRFGSTPTSRSATWWGRTSSTSCSSSAPPPWSCPFPPSAAVLTRDLPVMVGLFVLCLPLMRSRGVIGRFEGALLFAAYVAYIVLLVSST